MTHGSEGDGLTRGSVTGAAKSGALTGAAFERHSHPEPTVDGEPAGRWVAVDESGWSGEALAQAEQPWMALGSVAIDDEAAAEVVAALRRDAGVRQAGELKFGHFAGRGGVDQRRLEVLAAALRPGGALDGRAGVYLIDKRYFAVSKIVDLLLEEYAHDHGDDLYSGDEARQIAWRLYQQGPRALDEEVFADLVLTFTRFAGARNRGQHLVNVDTLFDMLDRAERRSKRRAVTDILQRLLRCRDQAVELQRWMLTPMAMANLEPLVPSTAHVLGLWSHRLGPTSMIIDANRALTDNMFDVMWRQMVSPHPDFRHLWWRTRPRGLHRGNSVDHPSIQLADLVAGAGRAVAYFHEGVTSSSTRAGEILADAVVPTITAEGMFPHDDPQRFAAPAGLRRYA